jgi:Tol biopolymer transport system component
MRFLRSMFLFIILNFIFACAAACAEDGNYKVFFLSGRDEVKDGDVYKPEIYVMNPDGSNQTRLTSNMYRELELTPTKDGKKLAFVSDENDDYDIEWINYDGSDLEHLSDDYDNYDIHPVISRDRTWMIYASRPRFETPDKQYDYEIWQIALNTREKKQLTNNDLEDYYCDLAPNESEIICLQSHDNSNDDHYTLHYIDLKTGEEGSIGNPKLYYNSPVYSPDGKYIATSTDGRFTLLDLNGNKMTDFKSSIFCSDYDFPEAGNIVAIKCGDYKNSRIFVMEIGAGYKVNAVTPEEYNVGKFDVSPDGKTVFFSAPIPKTDKEDIYWEIYRVGTDGSGFRQLTDNRAYDYSPVVSPLLNNDSDVASEEK